MRQCGQMTIEYLYYASFPNNIVELNCQNATALRHLKAAFRGLVATDFTDVGQQHDRFLCIGHANGLISCRN